MAVSTFKERAAYVNLDKPSALASKILPFNERSPVYFKMPYLELNQSLWDETDVHLAIQNDGELSMTTDDLKTEDKHVIQIFKTAKSN